MVKEYQKGLLKAKTALVFNTSNTPQERELEVVGDPLERLWKDCICSFLWNPGLLPQDVWGCRHEHR